MLRKLDPAFLFRVNFQDHDVVFAIVSERIISQLAFEYCDIFVIIQRHDNANRLRAWREINLYFVSYDLDKFVDTNYLFVKNGFINKEK